MRQLKERLDVLLVKKGFFSSRERAKIAIMEGDVYVGGAISDKAGTKIDVDAEISVPLWEEEVISWQKLSRCSASV